MDEASARNAPRRRSLDAKEEAHWLTDELEAVGELKRGAIAAQFPEEFNVDSDFLNGTNVWLPARLHPEIAPGEFQEWLKKHGSQLSKMEDSVNRRKSILSYSVSPEPRQSSGRSVRRRNTTQLVRRKTFVERAAEEEEKDAPFLVQSTKSSLKRSKLANKRRDSTASSTGRRRRREASPLVPGNSTDEDAPASRAPPAAVDGARLSTAEILKQVTAAVDDLGFDELGAGDLDGYDAHALAAPPAGQQQQQQQPATPSTQAPQQGKTVTHKKSASWWQWGGRDDSNGAEEKEPHPPMPQTPNSAAAQPAPDSSLKAKLPSPISFLRFNRRSKKDRRSTDEPGAVQPAASSAPPAPLGLGPKKQPSASASASAAAPAPPAPAVQAQTEESDGASDGEGATQKPSIPSIITPVRPPPTRLAAGNSRLPIHIERAIYRLASIKLANPRRPLLQQVLLSNMMFWYLELINPRSQQQPQQQQQHPQQHPQQQMHQHMQHRSPSPDPLGSVDKRGKRGHKAREQGNRRRSSGGGERVMRSPQYERQQQQIYMGAQQQQPYPNNVYYQQPVPPSSNSDEDDDVPLALYRGERNAMSIG
ncbi:hypothetical protein GGI25_006248 [Coemansia spiralis]|uniref:Protein Zds1 C-terminal domain-containing protein n=1 Tax=Coemansia spiralis TaxID=417178 RepID=A0A9W8KVP4_9FUNG|nr:hypothetical protein GGI25_006248 [Coemansia spiralis]